MNSVLVCVTDSVVDSSLVCRLDSVVSSVLVCVLVTTSLMDNIVVNGNINVTYAHLFYPNFIIITVRITVFSLEAMI